MRKSKIKEAVKKSLHVYYDKGLTSTAAKFQRELFSRIIKKYKK